MKHIHNGRTQLKFTPKSDIYRFRYVLKVYRSTAEKDPIFKIFPLPEVNPLLTMNAAVINPDKGLIQSDQQHLMMVLSFNSRFDFNDSNLIQVEVWNNDKVIKLIELNRSAHLNPHNLTLKCNQFIDYRLNISRSELLANATNGGVLFVQVKDQTKEVTLQRRIMLLPPSRLTMKLSTSSEKYEPNQQVKFDLQYHPEQVNKDEKVFVSVVVTDISSYFKTPSHLLQPGLPSMVYLEKSVSQELFDQEG